MRTFFNALLLLSFLSLGIASCSEDPVTPPEDTAIKFTLNSEATFDVYPLDTATSNENKRIEQEKDTVRQKTISTTMTVHGKTNVVAKENRYGNGLVDTTYFWQSTNGDLYMYNFGVDLINKSETVQAILQQQISVGWVLVARMSGSAVGTSWDAVDTSVSLVALNGAQVRITSRATSSGETTFTYGAKTVKAKKFIHTVKASLGGMTVASTQVEALVSLETDGVVQVTRKVANISLPPLIPSTKAFGSDMVLTSYAK